MINHYQLFFKELFKTLSHNQITYGILKHYDKLPKQPNGDVDIWVYKDHLQKFVDIMLDVASNQGWGLMARFPMFGHANAGGYFFIKNYGEKYVCELDVTPFFQWRGIRFLDETILPGAIQNHPNGFKVVPPGIEAAAMIFRGSMMGEIKHTDQKRIVECLKRDPQTFLQALEKPFGRPCAEMILEDGLAEKWDLLEHQMKSLQRTVLKRALGSHPVWQMGQWGRYFWMRLKAHLNLTHGFFLVLMGPDGAGKTTISQKLMDSELIRNMFCKREFLYRRFHVPGLRKIALKVKGANISAFDTEVQGDGSIVPLKPVKAAIYVIYLGFEYFLGHYWLRRIKANSGLVVFDRYFYDYLIFQDFLGCPRWLLKSIAKIVPRPDAIVYLQNDPRTIYARKPEMPLAEIERQVKICEELVAILPNGYTVNTSNEINNVINDIINIVINQLRIRTK
jgi:thymidylate kinase